VRPAQPGAQVGAQVGIGAQGQAGINNNNFSGIRQQPWFNPRVIRQQLNLNDDQFNQLNRSYGEYWNRYNQGMSQLGRDLNEQQRMQRLRELEGNFQRDFSTSTNRVFTDPQQRERFNQLYLQYQGYGAFSDPRIQQQLNLTPQQRQRLNELNTEWNSQMGRLGTEFRTGDEGVTNRMRTLQQQFNQRFNTILNDEQRQTWQGMVGEPFNFPPEVFFQTNTDVGTQLNTNPGANPNTGTNRTNRTNVAPNTGTNPANRTNVNRPNTGTNPTNGTNVNPNAGTNANGPGATPNVIPNAGTNANGPGTTPNVTPNAGTNANGPGTTPNTGANPANGPAVTPNAGTNSTNGTNVAPKPGTNANGPGAGA
jgi:hypothetical protein